MALLGHYFSNINFKKFLFQVFHERTSNNKRVSILLFSIISENKQIKVSSEIMMLFSSVYLLNLLTYLNLKSLFIKIIVVIQKAMR